MTFDITRVHALCFDVDGTLSDTDDAWVKGISRLLSPLRFLSNGRDLLPFSRWLVMTLESPGNLAYHLLDRLDLDDDTARLLAALARKRDAVARHFWLVPRVDEALHAFFHRFPMAIVSARGSLGTHAFLDQFGLAPLFKAVATAQTCRFTKPFPDPILWAAGQLGVPPQNCLMIGDTTVDIRAGRAAGAQTVGVLCGFGTERELRRAGADLVLPSPWNLIDILAELLFQKEKR
jgi:phosphoglycolate phosphatase-like HAD superfamily hydrolase